MLFVSDCHFSAEIDDLLISSKEQSPQLTADDGSCPASTSAVQQQPTGITDQMVVADVIDDLLNRVIFAERQHLVIAEISRFVSYGTNLSSVQLFQADTSSNCNNKGKKGVANIVRRRVKRLTQMTATSSAGASDSDSDAASLFKRRSSRFVPGYSIEDNFLNAAAKTLSLDALLQSLLPKGNQLCDESMDKEDEQGIPPLQQSDHVPLQQKPEDVIMSEEQQRSVAREIIARFESCSAVDALRIYLTKISSICCHFVFPGALRAAYLEGLRRYESDSQFYSPMDLENDGSDDGWKETIRKSGLHYLTAVEMLSISSDQPLNDRFQQKLIGRLAHLSSFCDYFDVEFECRAHWALYRLQLKGMNCVDRLHLALDAIGRVDGRRVGTAGGQLTEEQIKMEVECRQRASFLLTIDGQFEMGNYEDVASHLLLSFQEHPNTMTADSRIQYGLVLLKSLRHLHRTADCVRWTKRVFDWVMHEQNSATDKTKHLITINDVMENLDALLLQDTQYADDCLLTMTTPLIKLCKMTTEVNIRDKTSFPVSLRVTPWIALYSIANRLEQKTLTTDFLVDHYRRLQGSSSSTVLAFPSLMILQTAHAKLGLMAMCSVMDNRLPMLLAEQLRIALQHPLIQQLVYGKDAKFKAINDNMLNEAEQCFYCLYRYISLRTYGKLHYNYC